MTTLQQQEMTQTKRLHLSRGRKRRYYMDTFIVTGLSIFFWFLIAKGFINQEGHYKSPYFAIFIVFPLTAGLLYLHQKNSLRLTELETNLSKQDNYKAVKATLQELKWQIKVDNKGFIEAYTEIFGIITWADQMFSVVITDNRIFINNICNVDTYATQAIAWGQNTRNVKRFTRTFEHVSTMQFS
ncbi:MAG: hypothetical protein EKK37_05335 [Sphingobacteriales bacterium]|nr:MAG: hypothetical protein EKK37_05335 [Sphingobacteriales bacterium]